MVTRQKRKVDVVAKEVQPMASDYAAGATSTQTAAGQQQRLDLAESSRKRLREPAGGVGDEEKQGAARRRKVTCKSEPYRFRL